MWYVCWISQWWPQELFRGIYLVDAGSTWWMLASYLDWWVSPSLFISVFLSRLVLPVGLVLDLVFFESFLTLFFTTAPFLFLKTCLWSFPWFFLFFLFPMAHYKNKMEKIIMYGGRGRGLTLQIWSGRLGSWYMVHSHSSEAVSQNAFLMYLLHITYVISCWRNEPNPWTGHRSPLHIKSLGNPGQLETVGSYTWSLPPCTKSSGICCACGMWNEHTDRQVNQDWMQN